LDVSFCSSAWEFNYYIVIEKQGIGGSGKSECGSGKRKKVRRWDGEKALGIRKWECGSRKRKKVRRWDGEKVRG
jgi:hypothetical protein